MNIEIANRLLNLRKETGLSQESLAEQLGISRQAVSKWERGEASPDTDNLIALAKIYKISLDDLLLEHAPDKKTSPASCAKATTDTRNQKDSIRIVHEEQDPAFSETRKKGGPLPVIHFLLPVAIVLIYGMLGTIYHIWHPTWMIFLLLPLGSGFSAAIRKNDWRRLPYTLLVTTIYLTAGFLYNAWHPAWLIFFTIPLYYTFIHCCLPPKNKPTT